MYIQNELANSRMHVQQKARKEAVMATRRDSDVSAFRTLVQSTPASVSKYDRLIAKAKAVAAVKTVVVHPCDETSLCGLIEAARAESLNQFLWTDRQDQRRRARAQARCLKVRDRRRAPRRRCRRLRHHSERESTCSLKSGGGRREWQSFPQSKP